MKIFDCTTYHSEDLMLDVRFNILDEHVHKFIIIESEYSHSGQKKKLNFNIDNFKKFKDKIIYLPIRNEPEGIEKITNETDSFHKKRMNSIKRIEQSYDFMINGIKDASDEDLIVLSDNDEIPNFNSTDFKRSKKNILIFKQLFFYYKFDLLYDRLLWHGSRACKKKYLKSFSWLKNIKNKKYPLWRLDTYFSPLKQRNLDIINNGGWHFTNVKDAEDLFIKLSNYGHHNEFEATGYTVDDLKKHINDKIVTFNHFADKTDDNSKYDYNYKLKNIDYKLLPEYLTLNKDKYREWFD